MAAQCVKGVPPVLNWEVPRKARKNNCPWTAIPLAASLHLNLGYWLPCFLPFFSRFCQRTTDLQISKQNFPFSSNSMRFHRANVHCKVKVCNIKSSFSKSGLEKMDWEILEEPVPVALIKMKILLVLLLPRISLYHHIVHSWAQRFTHTHTYPVKV